MDQWIKKLLEEVGEDPARPDLAKTPRRFDSALRELLAGYREDPASLLANGTFESDSTGIVVCRDIHFVSMCEHHVLPFFGDALVAFLPSGKLVGISKIPRAVDMFARRLQVQERLGQQVLDAIQGATEAKGVLVRIRATHLCMMARGVKQEQATMETLHLSGRFEAEPALCHAILDRGP